MCFQFPERRILKDYLKPVLGILDTFFHRKHSVFKKHLPRSVLGQHYSDGGASKVRGGPALRVVRGPAGEMPVNSHDTVLRGALRPMWEPGRAGVASQRAHFGL